MHLILDIRLPLNEIQISVPQLAAYDTALQWPHFIVAQN